MKGKLTWKFLEFVEDAVFTAADLAAIFTAPYGSSFGRIEKRLREFQKGRTSVVAHWREEVIKAQAFRDLIGRLKRDGLIKKESIGKNKIPRLTTKGQKKLETLRVEINRRIPDGQYVHEHGETLKIVVFDIPERERWKRDWVRVVLRRLEFRMLQRSVWIGKTKVPRDFINDLKRLNLLSFVEIFAITKTGSLRHIA